MASSIKAVAATLVALTLTTSCGVSNYAAVEMASDYAAVAVPASGTSEVKTTEARPDAGDNFDSEVCDNNLISTLYGGAVRDVVVVAYDEDYFPAVAEENNWSFTPAAVFHHDSSEIRIDTGTCTRLDLDPDGYVSEAGRRKVIDAQAILAHEAAHALDNLYGWDLSDQANFVHTDIAHASKVKNGQRELFAFCMMEIAQATGSWAGNCPAENLEAVNAVLEVNGITL